MFGKNHGGTKLTYQLLELYPGKHVDIVERLVPDINMSAAAKALFPSRRKDTDASGFNAILAGSAGVCRGRKTAGI